MESFMFQFASSLLQDLIKSLNSLLIDKATQIVKFDKADELSKLEGELYKAQLLVDNLTTTSNWERCTGEVFKLCYDVEDLVDDLMVDNSNNSMLEKFRTTFKGKRPNTQKKIQNVRNELANIISTLKLVNKTQQQEQQCFSRKVLAPVLVGRKEEEEKIVTLLLDQTIRSVNIVGIGGLGKTALASNVQYHPRIKERFHSVRWVSVSTEFDLKTVAETILRQELESEYSFQLDRIRGLFEELYEGKSVLIVLDGLWDVTYEDWQLFSSLFLSTSGCKALVTTQNSRVASITGATPYHLPFMKYEDCRDLIISRTLCLNNLSSRQRDDLQRIAGAIAEKSKGLPSAASILLGHYLSSNGSEGDWRTLLERDILSSAVFKEKILPTLKLTTAKMGSLLKRCLAYCSLFPRNYDFKRDSLVQLWMAEGFIPPQDFGNEYFDDLYWRSFFQPYQLGELEIPSYRMHEFIHRFAEIVGSGLFCRLDDINCLSTDQVRHLSLLCVGVQLDLKNIKKCHGLRTFLLPNERGMCIGRIPYSFFQKLGRLRVLDLSRTDVDELPESLGTLKLLRYLDLSETPIESLPESISKLLGLLVLKLRDCNRLSWLPRNLYTLTNLVHLDVDTQSLSYMPASVGSLSHLQTLPIFFVGKKEGFRITELKNLKFLCGTINLVKLENVEDGAEAREAKLSEKSYIRRLKLEWSEDFNNGSVAMDVFANLQPHGDLKFLEVTHYVGSQFPTWLTSHSCRLVSIHMQDCWPDEVLSSLGQLPHLEILHIEAMNRVTVCGNARGGTFPSLKSLKIKDMKHLTRWDKFPDNCMPQLNDLAIMNCPSLSTVQSLNFMCSLQTLEIDCCPELEALPQLPPSIQSLIIFESDKVKRRCEQDGPEWSMIKSIPRVEIDYIKIVFP